jgi:hypothetical protein
MSNDIKAELLAALKLTSSLMPTDDEAQLLMWPEGRIKLMQRAYNMAVKAIDKAQKK